MSASHPDSLILNGHQFRPYITADRIRERVKILGAELSRDLANTRPVFLCVLKGAFLFFSDLVREFRGDCEVDFIRISSYGNTMSSSGSIELVRDVAIDLTGRTVVIVEDIVDTGLSMQFLLSHFRAMNPADVRIVTMLHKASKTEVPLHLDYTGFVIEPGFVIGYGLDYEQIARNLPDIYIKD